MPITKIDIHLTQTSPSPSPKRDALQALPGSGSVQVTVETNTGVQGHGSCFFGRIQGGPQSLAALIEQ